MGNVLPRLLLIVSASTAPSAHEVEEQKQQGDVLADLFDRHGYSRRA
ncbi:hypothetical protein SCAB_61331 [Streptomyces scabiei 87.22]|uniref:Uncharacterized protein n=1 Tax=Streptomyces scabiei (strain 87.22) TaxID=680198 RepID=C9Z965_STRSW|nr:hypothetical protein SCAB_61331 [Streptomyces scabiei 87.22]